MSLLRALAVLLCCFSFALVTGNASAAETAPKIDRHALVTRHNPHITSVDPWAPLTVGNGQFCFTADITGLQTFYDHYQKNGIGLETLARWAWHEDPNPQGYKLADANRDFTAYGKTLGYPTNQSGPAGTWLRENPHDMPLGQLGFCDENGAPLELKDITAVDQTLDMWTGELRSRFKWKGEPVDVNTVNAGDGIAVRINSPALGTGKLRVKLAFPRGHDLKTKNNPALDWSLPETHRTKAPMTAEAGSMPLKPIPLPTTSRPLSSLARRTKESQAGRVRIFGSLYLPRQRDGFSYSSDLRDIGSEQIFSPQPHVFVISGEEGSQKLEFNWQLSPRWGQGLDYYDKWEDTRASSAKSWKAFWESGAAVDFSGSKDPRARELERRVVLSQYLTAVQFNGFFPPQETGLTLSSWYGKHHTEMIWWHTAHFALWGRDAFLARNLNAFVGALPQAREIAKSRDLRGARWPKMVGPDWRESPGGNPLIIWNQPHPIHLSELLYRNSPTSETLARYRELVMETAECMASMLHWDEAKQRYNLGPPLWIAQEIYDQATSMNPSYELSYWIRG
ncbi:MAG: hypothetical protein ABIZ81_02655, partial [Opitutaceae bacterium]